MGVAFGEGGGVCASIVASRQELRVRDANCAEATPVAALPEGVGVRADLVLELGRGCVTCEVALLGRGGLTSAVGGLCGDGLIT